MQHDPTVGRENLQFLTDVVGAHFHDFTHGEYPCRARRQALQAEFEGFPETAVFEEFGRAAPVCGNPATVAVLGEQRVDDFVLDAFIVIAAQRPENR